MDDDYRVCSVCSALLTDDEVWADGSGSVVYTTSSLQIPMSKRGGHLVDSLDFRLDLSPPGIGDVDPDPHPRQPRWKPEWRSISETLHRAISDTVDVSMNGVLCEHCYVQQETTEFSGSYDFSDADELDPWAMFDE